MLEVFPAKSGDLTASVAGVMLHSRYDPRREARRYLDDALSGAPPSTLILLGTGLGYLVSEARNRFPHSHIIAVSPAGAGRREHVRNADIYLDVSAREPTAAISAAIRPEDVAGLELLEWEPELRAAGARAEALPRAVRDILGMRNADVATTGFFGRRYLRNAVRTLLFTEPVPPLGSLDRPVCIAASGPRLERACSWISANRAQIELWALSSATEALRARGLTPDLIVHQDAGFYATLHLAEPARTVGGPVLMPLTAALPPAGLREGLRLIDQGTRFEAELLSAVGLAPARIPEAGTVAATATAGALAATEHPVYLAGLDLAREDIRAHARPHAFEAYLRHRESRFTPVYSQIAGDAFLRSVASGGGIRTERSLQTYAAWFRSLPPEQASRLRRVEPSPVDLGIAAAEDAVAASGTTAPRQPRTPSHRSIADRAGRLRRVIDRWDRELAAYIAAEGAQRSAGAEGREPERDPSGGSRTKGLGAELAYLVSAADFVALIAAGRSGDSAARDRSLRRLEESARRLFSRLRRVIEAAGPEGGAA